MDCFVGAANNNCQLTKVDYNFSQSMDASHPNLITSSSVRHFEVQGKENDNCIFYEKLVSSSVVLNQVELAKITNVTTKDKAKVQEDIDTANKIKEQMIDKDAICKVTPLEFKTRIDNEKNRVSSISSYFDAKIGKKVIGDPYISKCVGELYNPTASNISQ
jgi:hypothetical protein